MDNRPILAIYDEFREILSRYLKGKVNRHSLERWMFELSRAEGLGDCFVVPIKHAAISYIFRELISNKPQLEYTDSDEFRQKVQKYFLAISGFAHIERLMQRFHFDEETQLTPGNLRYEIFKSAGIRGKIKKGDTYFCEFTIKIKGYEIEYKNIKVHYLGNSLSDC